ncbi:copper resistance protein CopC [Patescibacteria group bacterium]|nr:copper resistance protein CopC [Patescibacteria group bacterium]
MKTLLITLIILLPLGVSAHATPVEYVPESSAVLIEAPTEVSIRFSERVEPGASRIQVKDDAGTEITTGEAVVEENPYVLSVPVASAEDGAYFVSWSVVSSDDGHFTKGGYAYVIGEGIAIPSSNSSSFEVVQISAVPEAFMIFVELLGNSILWGVIVLFASVFRKYREDALVRKGYAFFIALGVLLILIGGGGHIILKTSELADLNQIPFAEALSLYFAIVSGSATVIRMIAGALIGVVFFFRKKVIQLAEKFTTSEWILFALLLVFAYYRAKVSHATASSFLPDLGVLVNVFHLIGKDLWEGIIGILSVAYLWRTFREKLRDVFPRAFSLLALSFGLAGVTGAYIIWLHLKDFANISTTLWGERFLPLAASLIVAIALLAYHLIAHRYRPQWFSKFLSYTLPAEFASGVLVIFFSSLMIITSPPLHGMQPAYSVRDQGIEIAVAPAPHEDEKVLLTSEGKVMPTVSLDGGSEEGTLLELERRYDGGYVFPLALITNGTHTLSVIQPQESGYDARATFTVTKADFIKDEGRDIDLFTLVMMALAILSIIAAIYLARLVRGPYPPLQERNSVFRYGIAFIVTLLILSQIIGALQYLFGNSFKKECLADGNGWHVMLPARNGIPVSSVAEEGCMALGGSFHISDAREYRYLKSQTGSEIAFANDLTNITAGVPVTFEYTINDADGEPAVLSVIHEKLVHMVIVSADMKEFFHVHPDDESNAPRFERSFTFPRAGTYILAIDYAHGLKQESRTYTITVKGNAAMNDIATYPSEGSFDGYDVTLRSPLPLANSYTTLTYRITKDGEDVLNMEPYLAAAMHLAVVKNDLSEFIHTHGEVHPLGAPVTQVSSTTAHTHLPPPPTFGPVVEAHVLFPSPGLYTVFGEFFHEGKVINPRFTVRVE